MYGWPSGTLGLTVGPHMYLGMHHASINPMGPRKTELKGMSLD